MWANWHNCSEDDRTPAVLQNTLRFPLWVNNEINGNWQNVVIQREEAAARETDERRQEGWKEKRVKARGGNNNRVCVWCVCACSSSTELRSWKLNCPCVLARGLAWTCLHSGWNAFLSHTHATHTWTRSGMEIRAVVEITLRGYFYKWVKRYMGFINDPSKALTHTASYIPVAQAHCVFMILLSHTL